MRSAADGQVFGLIPEVADRYRNRRKAPSLEIWKFNRQVRSIPAGGTLRIQAASPFRLRWTSTNGSKPMTRIPRPSGPAMSMWTSELPAGADGSRSLHLFLDDRGRWEGRDFQVGIDTGGRSVPAV